MRGPPLPCERRPACSCLTSLPVFQEKGNFPDPKQASGITGVEMQRRQVGVANVLRGCAEEPLQRQTSALATYIFSAEGLTSRLKQVRVCFIISTAQR